MKRLLTLIVAAVALQSCSLAHFIPSHAYPSANITINIDLQPAWGPVGYDYAAFYYMPEINVYYDVNHSHFYYHSNNRWLAVEYLPPAYRVYDLFKIYKVVLNYDKPWEYNRSHRAQYKHYRDDRTQIPIRLSNDSRYQKSWDNLRPWVDPNRRSNRENDYHLRTQDQQAGSSKYIEDKRNDGYRVAGGENNGTAAGDAYRQKDRTPNNNTPSSSSSYREKSTTPSAPKTDGVSSRGNSRKQTTTEPKPKSQSKTTTESKPKSQSKPATTKSNEVGNSRSEKSSSRSSTDKSASSPSPSASYRSNSSGTTTSTRGR